MRAQASMLLARTAIAAGLLAACAVQSPQPPALPPASAPVPADAQQSPPSPVQFYAQEVSQILAGNLRYPRRAIRAEQEGVCRMSVNIPRDGALLDAKLARSAGSAYLNQECIDVFHRIGRFPPLPADMDPAVTSFHLELPLQFDLTPAKPPAATAASHLSPGQPH
jgi:protein TonB